MADMTHIATTVDPDFLAELSAMAKAEDRSMANILRRGARRELIEHQRSTQRLQNGRTRKAATAKKSSSRKREAVAA